MPTVGIGKTDHGAIQERLQVQFATLDFIPLPRIRQGSQNRVRYRMRPHFHQPVCRQFNHFLRRQGAMGGASG